MSIYCKIKKDFGTFKLDVSFEGSNEVLALLGASGSGKSMILRCIAGIVKPDSGKIVVDDCVFFDSKHQINLTPRQRRVGLLFQDYALFPNMTVADNIRIAMNENYRNTLEEVLENYHLSEQQNQYPHQLSGGQKQRCAIARMIVTCPNIILLDEPFCALDSFLKYKLEKELFQTIAEYGKTVLLVSHNRDEVYRLSQKVSVIMDGLNMPMTEKHELFAHPQNYHSALLTGCKNVFPAQKQRHSVYIEALNLHLPLSNPAKLDYAGIRANDIFYIDFKQQSDDRFITFDFTIESRTEGLYNYILLVRPIDAKESLVMEVSKDKFADIDPTKGVLVIKYSNIMFLL